MSKKSVGIVKTEILKLDLPEHGFQTEKGGVLPRLEVAFERYGELSDDRHNVILVCHGFSGDAHAAGYHESEKNKPGWWEMMIGPGKAIDTEKFHIISTNVLGGCMGTTGPASINPATGNRYAADFPEITIGDMVRVQKLFLDKLGIEKLYAVIGGSAGGLQVLEWSFQYPDSIDRAICIAAAEHLSAQALSFDIVARNIIMADPKWNNGKYYGSEKPSSGLSLARMIGHITYLSKESMDVKFGRERAEEETRDDIFHTNFQIESYLNHQGKNFVERFDANSFLYITSAMDSFSLADGRGSFEKAAKKIKCKFLIISLSSDWLYPADQSRELAEKLLRSGLKVTYCNLSAPYGHDSFLIENEDLAGIISSYIDPRNPESAYDALTGHELSCDYEVISRLIKQNSKILDLGCGDGSVLQRALRQGNVSGHGIDFDIKNIIECNRKDVPVFQVNLDEGLEMIPDSHYDYAILSRTLLEVHKPHIVLSEMVRVAKTGIVSFTNFANWRHRLRLGIRGRLPMSEELPHNWYDTPNLHFLSLKDFRKFCTERGIGIQKTVCIPRGIISRLLLFAGLKNLGTDRVIVKITKK